MSPGDIVAVALLVGVCIVFAADGLRPRRPVVAPQKRR